MQKYELALYNSIQDVLSRLPPEIRNMSGEEFLMRSSEDPDFDANYNLSLRVVDNTSLGLLSSI
jgi:hypothetical protein